MPTLNKLACTPAKNKGILPMFSLSIKVQLSYQQIRLLVVLIVLLFT
jgi:hypothetical protein